VKLRVSLLLVIVAMIGVVAVNKIPKLTARQTSQIATVIKVADGDSITIRADNGTTEKIRLCGIDAPEKAQPLGQQSKQNLERLALNQQVAITPVDRDPCGICEAARYGRLVADVFVLSKRQEIFLSQDQLTAGLAYHYAQYSKNCPNRDGLIDAETIAKSKRLGLWADSYEKPWEFRQAQRKH
jgi:micrococcal nuclease